MKYRKTLSALSALLICAACATKAPQPANVQQANTAPSQTVADEQVADNDKICEYIQPTGTRFRKKVCMTRQEREQREQSAKALVQGVTRKSSACTGNNCR